MPRKGRRQHSDASGVSVRGVFALEPEPNPMADIIVALAAFVPFMSLFTSTNWEWQHNFDDHFNFEANLLVQVCTSLLRNYGVYLASSAGCVGLVMAEFSRDVDFARRVCV